MDPNKVGAEIEQALNAYAKKHGQPPNSIRLRRDVDEALHKSRLAFNYDFVDLLCSRERFMGMDVVLVDGGEEFAIDQTTEEGP